MRRMPIGRKQGGGGLSVELSCSDTNGRKKMTLMCGPVVSATLGVGPAGQSNRERDEGGAGASAFLGQSAKWAAHSTLHHGERGGGTWTARETRPIGPKAREREVKNSFSFFLNTFSKPN